jgi:hypothetical protein
MITLNYDSAIQKYLKPGEQLLRVAQPRQGWVFRWNNPLITMQVICAVLIVWWLFSVALWMSGAGGPFPAARPTPLNIGVVVLVAATIRQLIRDKRRRAGTWYAVTDQRLMFVRTNVRPQSVIGVPYDQIVEISAHQRPDRATPGEGILKFRLKEIDPYLSGSNVLGYQMSAGEIVLETVPDVQDLCELIQKQRAIAVTPVL